MKTRLVAIALILVGLGAAGISVVGLPTLGASSESKYITSTVTTGTVSATSVATGTIGASTVYGLKFGLAPDIVSSSATTAGSGGSAPSNSSMTWPVKTVAVTTGQSVKKGDVLASADDAAAQIQVLMAQSNLRTAQAKLTKDKYALYATILSDRASLATAEQALATAQLAVANATLVAPADGLITAVNIVAGSNAASGYAIELACPPMIATASFAEADITSLKVGQAASVTVTAASATVDGTVSQIVPVASTAGGGSSVVGYTVMVTLDSAPEAFLAGMSATVTVTTASVDDVLRVPATALSGSASAGYSVTVVDGNGSAATRSVEVGLVTTSYAQISNGVTEGELIVVGTSSSRTSSSSGSSGVNLGGLTGGGGFSGGGFRP
jgi:macrolide-specific efflux system membrane fusion protein